MPRSWPVPAFPSPLRERESLAATRENSNRAGYAAGLTTVLPLPRGEGRGEGKTNVGRLKVRDIFKVRI